MSDDGEIRERLQRLGLELRQERNQRVRAAHARRQNALARSHAAREELGAALAATEPARLGDWQLALAELAALRMLETRGNVDAERAVPSR